MTKGSIGLSFIPALVLGIAVLFAPGIAASAYAQTGGLHTLHAQGDVYMIVGPNYNSARFRHGLRNCGGVPRCRFLVKPFANL
jgi:hypothetical protein